MGRGRTEEKTLPEFKEFDEGEIGLGSEEKRERFGGFVAEFLVCYKQKITISSQLYEKEE